VDDLFVVGQVVPLTFCVTDKDGRPANAGAAALTVTKPGGGTDTPTLVAVQPGRYEVDYVPATAGRYIALAVFTGVNAGTAVDVFDVQVVTNGIVDLTAVKDYLGTDISWSDAAIQSALDAERAAQAKVCRIDDYGVDMREALCRRVARNLAARAVPVAQHTSFEGGGTVSRVPRTDPEIARLEAPNRRQVVG